MSRARIGLALGSGAARGWAHIGVIAELAEIGIVPDIICGTSIGALVGAAYVTGKLEALRQWAEAATWREIVGLLDVHLSGGGLIDGKLVVELLDRLGIAGRIESQAKPFAAIATDLRTGREVWLQSGPIQDAVRASIALPGIFSPAAQDGDWLVDGGLTNPVPVSVCRALGAEVIIAVNLNGELLGRRLVDEAPAATSRDPGEFLRRIAGQLPASLGEQAADIASRLMARGPAAPGYFDVLTNSINIMQDQITRARLAGEPPHVMLMPRLREIGLMEFNRAKDAIAEGRASVRQAQALLLRYK